MRILRESLIERKLSKYFEDRGGISIKIGFNGYPDRLFIKNGVCLFIEFKSGCREGGISPLQMYQIERLMGNGVLVEVIDDLISGIDLVDRTFFYETLRTSSASDRWN